MLVWQYIGREVDLRRTLQIASGAYLLFYIPGHMNSVFIYARAIVGIPTDWNFATGVPQDCCSMRGTFACFLTIYSPCSLWHAPGSRRPHHRTCAQRERQSLGPTRLRRIAGAAIPVAIMVGMTGVHLH